MMKWVSQIIILLAGIVGLLSDTYITNPSTGKRLLTRTGLVTLALLLMGFFLFTVIDIKERSENALRDVAQRQQITELNQTVQQLNKLAFDRDIAGIEISFRPSAEHWARIVEKYRKIQSPVPQAPYSMATLIADRVGGHWNIDFTPVSLREGVVRFGPVSTDEPNNKAFEDVIREASLGMLIKWGDSVETELEPRRDVYPTTIMVSQDLITLTLRPPLLRLTLNVLIDNPTIALRGKNYPDTLRLRSLDPNLILDQTVTLKWEEKEDSSYLGLSMPYISGPHRLDASSKL